MAGHAIRRCCLLTTDPMCSSRATMVPTHTRARVSMEFTSDCGGVSEKRERARMSATVAITLPDSFQGRVAAGATGNDSSCGTGGGGGEEVTINRQQWRRGPTWGRL